MRILPAQKRLRRVTDCLWQLWQLGRGDVCVLNLPLLAELLEEAGESAQARAAREVGWSYYRDTLRQDLSTTQIKHTLQVPVIFTTRWYTNNQRLFWFPPNSVHIWRAFGPARLVLRVADAGFTPDTDLHPTLGALACLDIFPEEPAYE